MNDMTQQPAPIGELFSRVYLERGAPLRDNPRFRNRLDAYLWDNHQRDYSSLAAYLRREAGLTVRFTGRFDFSAFFATDPIEHVLDAITLIWQSLDNPYSGLGVPAADKWHAFVSRAMREENMGYRLDEQCGVHRFVDEEFERNRVSALACLGAPRYAGVRTAFEAAHNYLDAHPADTKASVRSAFESLEILARLMALGGRSLSKRMVEDKLKPLALAGITEPSEVDTVSKLFDGLAQMVDGLHNYRHGQGVEQPVAPSLTMAIYVVSTVAAALRWLTALDAQE